MRLLALFIALATALQAAVPLQNPRITGSDSKVASGTFTIESGATFAVEAGAFFALAEKLPLNAGGTGASLSDPGADRLIFWDDSEGKVDWLSLGSGLSISGAALNVATAPPTATYITQTPDGTLANEQALSALATGLMQVTTSTGVISSITTSAGVAGLISDETGSGALVFGTSPTITTPTITAPVFAGTWTLPAGATQSFEPDATSAGLNVGSYAGDPSAVADGDLWYNTATNALRARINGGSVSLGAGGGGGGGGGTLTLSRFSALDNQPPASNYATFDTRNSIAVLDFDASTDEHAVFVGIIPEGADFTTGITLRLHWMATSATSGDVVWVCAFERSNTDLDSDSFATGVSVTSTANGTSGIVTVTSIDFSDTEVDGVVAGSLYRVKITRDADNGSDTMSGDAELVAVEVRQR